MKIKRKDMKVNISEINIGECFLYEDNLYMKVDKASLNVASIYHNIVINLENNKLGAFADYVKVKNVEAYITLDE